MADLIDRGILMAKMLLQHEDYHRQGATDMALGYGSAICDVKQASAVDAVEIPPTGIGDLSDGYHTFNGLYYQRMILFAALVKVYKDKAWKSHRHENGELCFGGGWFIVGIDTPDGSYTYHYKDKYYDLFDCVELPVGKYWDGHTEKDVTRLMSLPVDAEPVRRGRWLTCEDGLGDVHYQCSECGQEWCLNDGTPEENNMNYCPHCGAKMEAGE